MYPLHDIDDEPSGSAVRPTLRVHVGLRGLTATDATLVQAWLGFAELEEALVHSGSSKATVLTVRPRERAFMIVIERTPVGYLRCGLLPPQIRDQPELSRFFTQSTLEVQIFIPDRSVRCLGIGSAALAQLPFCLSTLNSPPLVGRCSVRNFTARHAFEKAGFLHHVFYADPHLGPSVAMLREG
jgi:hypothetical protein